jgi:uncharacterized membrane protein
MDTKRFFVGTIVGGIVLFALGYVIFELLLGSFMSANMTSIPGLEREAPQFWALGVGCLAYAALICYAMGRQGAAAGAKVGAIVGLLLWATADFTTFAFQNSMNLTVTLVDPLASMVHAGIAGAVIALVVGKMKAAS